MHDFACIFDCDGTLIDSMAAWRAVEDELACQAGVALTKQQTDLITTFTLPEVGALFHEEFGLGDSAQDVLDVIDELMGDFYTNHAEGRPGALAFVQALYARGIPMAVASSTPTKLLKAAVDHAGFAPYMQAVISVDDVGHSKREPNVYDYARSFLGTQRRNTIGFEDAAYALTTLRNTGYCTVGIYDCDLSGTKDQLRQLADVYIESFEDLYGETFCLNERFSR